MEKKQKQKLCKREISLCGNLICRFYIEKYTIHIEKNIYYLRSVIMTNIPAECAPAVGVNLKTVITIT